MTKAIANALKRGIDEVLAPAVQDAGKTVKKAMHSVADGAEKVAGHAEEAEGRNVEELAKAAEKKGEPLPVYVKEDDGQVHRLNPDGTRSVVKKGQETSGIDELLESDGRIAAVNRDNHRLGRDTPKTPGPRVSSTKVAPGTGELPEATLRARKAAGDGKLVNYAAAKYEADGKGFILVSHSGGPHSETHLGVPFLRKGMDGGVTELYTEREPCDVAQNFCGEWLHKYFGNTTVTHSFDYSKAGGTQAAGNKALRTFLKGQGL